MMKGKVSIVALHCVGWLVFFSLPVIFIASQSSLNNTSIFTLNPFNFLSFSIYIVIFYLHTYFLFPLLFFRKKWILYVLSVLLLLAVILYLRPFDRSMNQHKIQTGNMPVRPGPPPRRFPPPGSQGVVPPFNADSPMPAFTPPQNSNGSPLHIDIISIVLFILVLALSIALTLENRWRIAVEQTARAETDKANAELSFLKAQINPHFLFNTLNNIYALAITKSENVADAIMKLSNIMRYVTDDVNEDFVSLDKELDSINDYISLQRLRLGRKASIDFTVEGSTHNKTIAPLILMPFVENAFTHGISNSATSNIIVKLTATDKYIVFYTENKFFDVPRNVERTGIGTANTKKRLAQIYPEKYLLDIGAENGLFTVHLVMYI